MTICEFCGKEIPDGGICDCAESVEAAEVAVFEEEDTVDEDAYGEDADSGGNSIIDEINADNDETQEAAEEEPEDKLYEFDDDDAGYVSDELTSISLQH